MQIYIKAPLIISLEVFLSSRVSSALAGLHLKVIRRIIKAWSIREGHN